MRWSFGLAMEGDLPQKTPQRVGRRARHKTLLSFHDWHKVTLSASFSARIISVIALFDDMSQFIERVHVFSDTSPVPLECGDDTLGGR